MCPFPVQRPIDIWKNIGATRTIVLAVHTERLYRYCPAQRSTRSCRDTICLPISIIHYVKFQTRTSGGGEHIIKYDGPELNPTAGNTTTLHQPAQHPQPGRHSTHSRMREEQKTYYPFTCSTSRRVRSKLGQPEEHQEQRQQNGHFHVSGRFSIWDRGIYKNRIDTKEICYSVSL